MQIPDISTYEPPGSSTSTSSHFPGVFVLGHTVFPPANVVCFSGTLAPGEPHSNGFVVAAESDHVTTWPVPPVGFTVGDITIGLRPGWKTQAASSTNGGSHHSRLPGVRVTVRGETVYELDSQPDANTTVDLAVGRLVLNEQGSRQRADCVEHFAAAAHLTLRDGSELAVSWVSTCA